MDVFIRFSACAENDKTYYLWIKILHFLEIHKLLTIEDHPETIERVVAYV